MTKFKDYRYPYNGFSYSLFCFLKILDLLKITDEDSLNLYLRYHFSSKKDNLDWQKDIANFNPSNNLVDE